MTSIPEALQIIRFHDNKLQQRSWPELQETEADGGVWIWIAANHRYNGLLWNEEDKARRTDVGAQEIAACKRLIDQYNQKRNDAVEAIDEAILESLGNPEPAGEARLNSETAGAMIDRLSILSLKIFHMKEQTQRVDVDLDHIRKCETKLERLTEQRIDLGACFDVLLDEARTGRAYFKVYRQFKMYNDPSLNPYLYAARARSA